LTQEQRLHLPLDLGHLQHTDTLALGGLLGGVERGLVDGIEGGLVDGIVDGIVVDGIEGGLVDGIVNGIVDGIVGGIVDGIVNGIVVHKLVASLVVVVLLVVGIE
jgi:hypothetical protein